MEKNTRCRKATLAIAALLVAGALYPMTALAANKLIVNGTDGVTPAYVVTDSGYIGIGNSAPLRPIHTVGPTTGTTQILSQTVRKYCNRWGRFCRVSQ